MPRSTGFVLILLLILPVMAGCFGAGSRDRDGKEVDAEQTALPPGLEMQDADVISYNRTTVVWRWSGTTGPGTLSGLTGTSTGTATAAFDVPAGLRVVLDAELTWGDAAADLGLEVLADESWIWCSSRSNQEIPADGDERCGGGLGPFTNATRWAVQVTTYMGPNLVQPFEITLTLRAVPLSPIVPEAPRDATCDVPLLGERVRMREIDAATNPADPSELAVAMIATEPSLRDQAPNDWQMWNALARSTDAGRTWTFAMLPGWHGDTENEPSPFHGATLLTDPIVMFLQDGTLLYSGLILRDGGMDLFVSRFAPDAMAPESTAIVARGTVSDQAPLNQLPTPLYVTWNEKQHLDLDPATGDVFLAWEQRTAEPETHATVNLARSTDGGRTWTTPKTLVGASGPINPGSDWHGTPHPFATEDGAVHVVWIEWNQANLYLASSDDRGETFSEPRLLVDFAGAFEDASGVLAPQLLDVAVDRTGGPFHGSVYVVYSGEDHGDEDPFLLVSRDHGRTWQGPKRIVDDPPGNGNHQLHPVVTVDPDGVVSVLYLDRRNDPYGWAYQAQLARSSDGGKNWTHIRLAGEPSDPREIENAHAGHPDFTPVPRRTRVGEYHGLTWTEGGLFAVWQDGRDGTRDMPYSTAWMCLLADPD